MKPRTYALVWLLELLSLTVVYSMFCYFVPEDAILTWYEERYGFVLESRWDDWFSLTLYFLSIAITTLGIWCIARTMQRKIKKARSAG